MKAHKLIELVGILDRTGQKKISLKYDDINDILLIEDNGILKKVSDEQQLIDIENKYIQIEEELKRMDIRIKDIKILSERITIVRLNSKPELTKAEQLIGYYYHCMTHNYGQGEGIMFNDYPQIPFHIIEMKWKWIVDKYKKRGYDI
jgi:hypothetical protein